MARPKKRRRYVQRTARCENGHEFPVKLEEVSLPVPVPGGGYEYTDFKPGNVKEVVECPICHTDRMVGLVEE